MREITYIDEPMLMEREVTLKINGLKEDIELIKYTSTSTCIACYLNMFFVSMGFCGLCF